MYIKQSVLFIGHSVNFHPTLSTMTVETMMFLDYLNHLELYNTDADLPFSSEICSPLIDFTNIM